MNEFLHNFHQKVAKDFISEMRLKSLEYDFVPDQKDRFHERLDRLEELIKKADHHETNNLEEYSKTLQELVIEKTKCFLYFDELAHKTITGRS
jgi:hypothetical protein